MAQIDAAIELGTLASQSPSKSQLFGGPNGAPTTHTTIGSRSASHDAHAQEDTLQRELSELSPMDKGLGAWSFVASAFILDTLVWGFGFTWVNTMNYPRPNFLISSTQLWRLPRILY
jgi:hypothetical protein